MNRPTRTKSGERVTPYLIEGRMVYAFDKNKIARSFDLSEFEVNKRIVKKKYRPVLMVKGSAPQPIDDNIFNPNESGGLGGLYEETPTVVAPPTVVTQPEPEPIIPETLEIETVAEGEGNISGSANTGFVPIPAAEDIPTYIYSDGEVVNKVTGVAASSFIANEDLPTRDYDVTVNKIKIILSGRSLYYHTVVVEKEEPAFDPDDFYGGL